MSEFLKNKKKQEQEANDSGADQEAAQSDETPQEDGPGNEEEPSQGDATPKEGGEEEESAPEQQEIDPNVARVKELEEENHALRVKVQNQNREIQRLRSQIKVGNR